MISRPNAITAFYHVRTIAPKEEPSEPHVLHLKFLHLSLRLLPPNLIKDLSWVLKYSD